ALRGVEATLNIIKHRLATDSIRIRGLGKLEVRPKRRGVLPGSISGESSRPGPGGRGVVLRATRGAVAKLNSEPEPPGGSESRIGGNMEKNQESESIKTTGSQSEGMAIGLDIGTSRVVLATGSAGQVKTASELNAFVTVPYSKFTENILKQNKVSFQHNGGGGVLLVFCNEGGGVAYFFFFRGLRALLSGRLNTNRKEFISLSQGSVFYPL